MTDGVLLVNLGTPSHPTPQAVSRFLREFLSDKKVVDNGGPLWPLILNGTIIPRRRHAVAELYQSIWMEEGSPLLVYSQRQKQALQKALGQKIQVAIAMRYGQPSIKEGLLELQSKNCRDIVVIPMFPQYSESTTGSIKAALRKVIEELAWPISWRMIDAWYQHPFYIKALCQSIKAKLSDDDHLMLSFHSLPVRHIRQGDPYQHHCEATALAIQRNLNLPNNRFSLAFQSVFGKEEWLGPQATDLVQNLAKKHKRLVVACPGFTADCLETLEEINQQLRELYLDSGGEQYTYISCLNDHPLLIKALESFCH